MLYLFCHCRTTHATSSCGVHNYIVQMYRFFIYIAKIVSSQSSPLAASEKVAWHIQCMSGIKHLYLLPMYFESSSINIQLTKLDSVARFEWCNATRCKKVNKGHLVTWLLCLAVESPWSALSGPLLSFVQMDLEKTFNVSFTNTCFIINHAK